MPLFRKNKALVWTQKVDDLINRVCISADGSLIAVGTVKTMYLFNPTGKLLWDYKIGRVVYGRLRPITAVSYTHLTLPTN